LLNEVLKNKNKPVEEEEDDFIHSEMDFDT